LTVGKAETGDLEKIVERLTPLTIEEMKGGKGWRDEAARIGEKTWLNTKGCLNLRKRPPSGLWRRWNITTGKMG
jgi:hypothetical protein